MARRPSITHAVNWVVACGALSYATTVRANSYYVTTTGDDSAVGTSEDAAWRTVSHAASVAGAGDTVYIRAGLYDNEWVSVANSGTEDAPIVFQGYTATPGDTPTPSYTPGSDLDFAAIPVLQGASSETAEEIGFEIPYCSFVEVRDLGVAGYNYGFLSYSSDHVTLDRVFADNNGVGIMFRSNADSTIRESVAVDSWTQNFFLWKTTTSTIESCSSYAVQTSSVQTGDNGTDYHIILADCQNVTVSDSTVENLHAQVAGSHPGHGIGIKDYFDDSTGTYPNPHSTGNRIVGCTALHVGEYFYAAHQSYGNEFVDCTAIGDYSVEDGWSSSIIIRDGAHDNTFRRFYGEGTHSAVIIEDSEEGEPEEVATGNLIVNSEFYNTRKGIELWYADDNAFRNCVFDATGVWTFVRFPYERIGTGNRLLDSIVLNVPGVLTYADAGSTEALSFAYSDFWNNAFEAPSGTGILAVDPLFVDPENHDYHLKSAQGRWDPDQSQWVNDAETSPCIDQGDPSSDFGWEPCPNGGRIDLGSYGNTEQASFSSSKEECVTSSDGDPTTETGGASSGISGDGTDSGQDGCGCRTTEPARDRHWRSLMLAAAGLAFFRFRTRRDRR